MKTRYFLLLAATVLLASCQKEFQTPEIVISKGVTTLEVGLPDTKTYLGDAVEGVHKVYWSNGDQIAVNGTASNALAELPENAGSATFTINGIVNTPFDIVYPASIYTDATHVTLPSVQTYKAGGFADGMFPMAGYSASGASIQLRHLCAIVKISVKRETAEHAEARSGEVDTDKIVSVRFSGNNSEKVSGVFELDYSSPALTAASGTGDDLVVSVAKSQSTSTSTAKDYYLVVPARTYSNGFTVTVKDASGHIMTKSKGSSWTPEAGKLYNMTAFEFVPTSTELGIEISNAAQLIAFARAYNNHEFDSLGDDVLVATLTDDISFVNSNDPDVAGSWAAFNATGGIGKKNNLFGASEDYYFNGIFNGGGYTISGLEATVPLFAAIGGAGHVSDFTIDNTCSFTFTHPNTVEGVYGSVVGYHKGVVDNVSSAAAVTLASVADVTYMTSLGGIAGHATIGVVKDSEYSGLISTPSDFTGTAKLIIGGLVGRFSNAGSVTGSYFKGAISNAAQITSTDKSNPYTIIGGIAGHVSGGASITSCSTTSDHEKVLDAYSTSVGVIVHKSTVAYRSAVGGIVGELDNGTVSSCTNGAYIMNTVFRDEDDDNTIARYMDTGGIVGKNNASGTVSGCTNSSYVYHRSNPRIQNIGGIVGCNLAGGTVSSCTNSQEVAQMTTGIDGGAKLYGGRVIKLGGVIGSNSSTNVSDVHNTATLTVSRTEAKAANAVDVNVGGVIGWNGAAIDGGVGKNITNTGKVYYNTNMSPVPIRYCLGGIVGCSSASVQNAVNSGYVHFNWTANPAVNAYVGGIVGQMEGDGTISGCNNEKTESANSGDVYLGVTVEAAHKDDCAGGILGYTAKNVTISNCNNSGYVHAGTNVTITDSNIYVGGFAGYLAGASSISNCTNTGYTNINSANNTDNDVTKIFADGGIVGVAIGTDANHIIISDCSWTYASNVGSRRGTCGGVAGYAEYTEISDCDVTVNYNMYHHVTGGIVGWAVNSTITGCNFRGTKIAATQAYVSGGIVGTLDAGSVVDGCSNYCTDITATKAPTVIGEIAAKSVAGSEIRNCHYTGTIGICSDSNYTNGGGNVADIIP